MTIHVDADGRRVVGYAMLVAGLCALLAGAVLATRPVPAPADAGAVQFYVAGSAPVAAATGTPPVPAVPSRLTIPALGVDAPVDPAGVGGDGSLEVPSDPSRLGWWIGSARPGSSSGTVLIAGHVDTARDGPGALYRLETLPLGSLVRVQGITYTVTARHSYLKRRLPAELFQTGTVPQLALVTCGGAFHDGSYDHNVVVYATPAPPPSGVPRIG